MAVMLLIPKSQWATKEVFALIDSLEKLRSQHEKEHVTCASAQSDQNVRCLRAVSSDTVEYGNPNRTAQMCRFLYYYG